MFNPVPVVFADLRQHRAGVVAVILLVALAVALGVAVSAQERALRQGSGKAASAFDLIVGAPGSETQLVLSSVYLQVAALDLVAPDVLVDLTANPQVKFAAPLAFGDSHAGMPIVGTISAFIDRAAPEGLSEGRSFESIDEVVIGADVPLAIGDTFLPAHGVAVAGDLHEGLAYRVVGRMPKLGNPWDRAIAATVEAVWWVHSLPVGHVIDPARLYPEGIGGPPDLAAIPIGPPFDAAELSGLPAIVVAPASFASAYVLRQEYRNRDDTMAVFPAEVLIRLYALLGDVRDLVAIISILTQALVIGAILLAVLASLAQRRRLVAVLRALGASRAYIFTTIWLNVAIMLTAGAVLGLALGFAGAVVLAQVFEAQTSIALPVHLAWQEVRLVLSIVVVGLLLATVPAALTYRAPIAAALRS